MSCPITTHVLDTATGRPARDVPVSLAVWTAGGTWQELGKGVTDADGRNRHLLPEGSIREKGRYRMRFETEPYFQAQGIDGFYPYVEVVFDLREPDQHYHVPLLLSPYGFSTYRGS